MIRTLSLVLALSFIGAVLAIELRAACKPASSETPHMVEASLIPPSPRPRPRPVALAAIVTDRLVTQSIPLVEWAEAVDLDLRHSLRF